MALWVGLFVAGCRARSGAEAPPGADSTGATSTPAIVETQLPSGDEPPDGAALFTRLGCGKCHGVAGSGGMAPTLHGVTATRLDAQLRAAGSNHTGGPQPNLTDTQLAALAASLGGSTTATDSAPPRATRTAPADHTMLKGKAGIPHHAGLFEPQKNCTTCHGPDLFGSDSAPACWSCHGSTWDAPPDVPPTHTRRMHGIAHATGLESPIENCGPCHSPDLKGRRPIPGCYDCHGDRWTKFRSQ